jgi:hypothetical protein
VAWRIRYEGQVYREADLTLGQAEQIETMVDATWARISPLHSAKHAKAILAVMHSARSGVSVDEALAQVAAVTVDGFMSMLEKDEDDLPVEYADGFPQPADETSTST